MSVLIALSRKKTGITMPFFCFFGFFYAFATSNIESKVMRYIWVLLFVASLSLLACTDGSKESAATLSPALQQVESIMYQAPDSALRLLEAMSVPPASDSLNLATWALFTTQARYKLFMSQSDSLINVAYPYFLRHGDAQRKAMALYYKGAICKEQQHIEEAHQYYLRAAEEVDKTTDYSLGYLIYIGIADTYVFRSLSDYALQASEKAVDYALKSGNESYVSAGRVYQARIYDTLGQLETSIDYYKEAVSISENQRDYQYLAGVYCELAGIYNSLERYDSALYYVQKMITINRQYKLKEEAADYITIGNTYYYNNRLDSAIYYLNQILKDSTARLSQIAGSNQLLYFIYNEKGNYKESAKHCFAFCQNLDSLHRADKSKTLVEMQEKYDQQKLVNERNELQIENDQTIRNALLVATGALCIIVCLVYKLFKKERRIRKIEEQVHSKTLQIQENEWTISHNEKRIAELEEQLEVNNRRVTNKNLKEESEEQEKTIIDIRAVNEQLEQENQILEKEVKILFDKLTDGKSEEMEQLNKLTKENLRLHDREWFLCSQLLKSNEMLNGLKQTPHCITDSEWDKIKKEVDFLFDHFTQRLFEAIPSMTENELRLACLMKLHFSNSIIAILLSIEPNSVSKKKARLRDHIKQIIGLWGEEMTIDLWIWNF